MDEINPPTSIEPPALEIDLDVYMPIFDDESISDEDKRKLLEALWSVIVSFVQLGWGVHPVQQARASRQPSQDACGQAGRSTGPFSVASDFMLQSGQFPLPDQMQRASENEAQEG